MKARRIALTLAATATATLAVPPAAGANADTPWAPHRSCAVVMDWPGKGWRTAVCKLDHKPLVLVGSFTTFRDAKGAIMAWLASPASR